MARVRDLILAYLQTHPEGADDGELTEALGLKYRAQVNTCCRQLADEGLIVRKLARGRLRNYAVSVPGRIASATGRESATTQTGEKPWHWEGNVQRRAIAYLEAQGYTIEHAADTAAHEHGKDIIANKGGRALWVTVKGYPSETLRTRPSTQAGHWYKDALFDIVAWRGQDPKAELAIALPLFRRYRSLAEKVRWLQLAAGFSYLWVSKDGSVRREYATSEG